MKPSSQPVLIQPRVRVETKGFLLGGLASQTGQWRSSAGVMGSQEPVRVLESVSPSGGDTGCDACFPSPRASPGQRKGHTLIPSCCNILEGKPNPKELFPPRSHCLLFTPGFSGSGPLAQKLCFLVAARSGFGKKNRQLQVAARKVDEGTKLPAMWGYLIRLSVNPSGALWSQACGSSAERC